MNYLKLFIPIPIAVIIQILSENYFDGPNKVIAIIVKAGVFIYYLRLGNQGTPLINTLTLILLSMAVGEYLLITNTTFGQIILAISDIALGLTYFFRQKLKNKKDKLVKLKTTAVFIFVLTNLLSVDGSMSLIPLAIATLFLTFVYFYDRLVTVTDSRKIGA